MRHIGGRRRKPHLVRRLHEPRLHLIRSERALFLQQQSGCARNRRGRHAGAAQGEVITVAVGAGHQFVWIRSLQCGPRSRQRNNVISWRHDVRLHHVIVGRRSLRAKARFGLSRRRSRSIALGRAYCQHERIVARGGDGSIAVVAAHVQAPIISGCHNHHNPALPGCLDRLAERILGVADRNSAAQ